MICFEFKCCLIPTFGALTTFSSQINLSFKWICTTNLLIFLIIYLFISILLYNKYKYGCFILKSHDFFYNKKNFF